MLDRPRYVARYEWIRKKGMNGHIDYITRNANLQFRNFLTAELNAASPTTRGG